MFGLSSFFQRLLLRNRRNPCYSEMKTVAVRKLGGGAKGNDSWTRMTLFNLNSSWTKSSDVTAYVLAAFVSISSIGLAKCDLKKSEVATTPEDEREKEKDEVGEEVLSPADFFSKELADTKVKTHFTEATFVKRPAIEQTIRHAIYSSKPGQFHILYGARGVGTSSLLDKVVEGRKGVVKVTINLDDTSDTVSDKIELAVTGQISGCDVTTVSKYFEAYAVKETARAKMEATKKGASQDGRDVAGQAGGGGGKEAVEGENCFPTIIFELQRGKVDYYATLLARLVAMNYSNFCNCIIVLSEAREVLKFGFDHSERYIRVDEMTFDETQEFLKLQIPALADDEMKMIYDNIGGNPSLLKSLAKDLESSPLDECIQRIISSARMDLESFEIKPYLKALKVSPDGIRAGYFNGQRYGDVYLPDPCTAENAMARHNAIIFDMKTKKIQMESTKHKTALKTYDPIVEEIL